MVEQAGHIEELYELKRGARRGWVKDRLVRAAPSTATLFEELARRGENLGANVNALLRLLDRYGAERLEKAVCEALERETPDPRSVRLILKRARLESGLGPRVPVALRVAVLTLLHYFRITYAKLVFDQKIETWLSLGPRGRLRVHRWRTRGDRP